MGESVLVKKKEKTSEETSEATADSRHKTGTQRPQWRVMGKTLDWSRDASWEKRAKWVGGAE